MNAHIAILDIGTNTFHLLIADITMQHPQIIHSATIAVKLGEGGITSGTISHDAIERGVNALREFKKAIDYFKVTRVESAATSAIRSASNGTEFIARVKAETGIQLQIIDGDQEALLIYKGVRAALRLEQNSLIVDIGGGSVEAIICDAGKILWKKSYAIGAARLMEQFHHSDPISENDIRDLITYLDNSLYDLKKQLEFHKPNLMIGAAGAFETFALLHDPGFEASFHKPDFSFEYNKLTSILNMIVRSTKMQRANMPEIIPVRVDMIVVSAILTSYILETSGIKNLKLSTYSLKEGILFGMLK